MHLDRLGGHVHGGLGGVQFHRRGLRQAHLLAGGGHLDIAEHHVLQVGARHFHLRQFQLNQLVVADRAAELGAVTGVGGGQFQRALHHPQGHGGHAGALLHEGGLGAGAAVAGLAAAEQAVGAHLQVTEEQLAGGRGADAHLLERLGLLQAFHTGVENKGHDLAVLGFHAFLIQLADQHDGVGVGAVGDPGLAAVDDVAAVAVALCQGFHLAEGVGAGVGFRDRPGAHFLQGQQRQRPALFLFDGALAHDGATGEPHGHAHGGDQSLGVAAQFDDRDHGHRRLIAGALGGAVLLLGGGVLAVFGGGFLAGDLLLVVLRRHHVHAEGFDHLAQDVVGRHAVVFDIVQVGHHFLGHEVAHHLLDHLLLFVPLDHEASQAMS